MHINSFLFAHRLDASRYSPLWGDTEGGPRLQKILVIVTDRHHVSPADSELRVNVYGIDPERIHRADWTANQFVFQAVISSDSLGLLLYRLVHAEDRPPVVRWVLGHGAIAVGSAPDPRQVLLHAQVSQDDPPTTGQERVAIFTYAAAILDAEASLPSR